MKQLNIAFEDDDYKIILEKKEKSGLSWRQFLIDMAQQYKV